MRIHRTSSGDSSAMRSGAISPRWLMRPGWRRCARRAGSTDAAIREHDANDLAALTDSLPALRAVAFNGGTALRLGRPLLAKSALTLVALPSSSALHTVKIEVKQPQWDALAAFLA